MEPRILVHGGAGKAATPTILASCSRAAARGVVGLAEGAMAGVEAAIALLEDDPAFDAGYGAYPNLLGAIELDAGMMDGSRGRAAAVAAVRGVRHPIALARRMVEETPYVIVAGEGAAMLADLFGIERGTLDAPERMAQWRTVRDSLLSGSPERFSEIPAMFRNGTVERWATEGKLAGLVDALPGDTVGAVAIDANGCLAAGSSTGGSLLKWPGRVGSAAFQGAGFYAKQGAGAAAATGHGETLIDELVSQRAVEFMQSGATAQEAVDEVMAVINRRPTGARRVGLIAIDATGQPGAVVNIDNGLPTATCSASSQQPIAPYRTILLPRKPLPESAGA